MIRIMKLRHTERGDVMASKYKYGQIMNPWFDMPDAYDDLVSVYRTLAKTADQRLVRLESYEHDENFRNALKWSYARAQRDIKQWSGENAKRFNTAPPESKSSLLAKIEDIKTFLESPTSTKQGIKDVMIRRAETLNKEYGTKFKWDTVGKYFESELASNMDKKLASKTAIKVLGRIQKDKKEILKRIEEADAKDQKVPDKMVDKIIEDLIQNNRAELKDFLQNS